MTSSVSWPSLRAFLAATVRAESPMVVETLNRREFSSLLDESPKLARKILVGAVKRLHEIEEGVVR